MAIVGVQDPRLRMIAQGFIGDSEVQDGNHLRWAMAPELGFPPQGFQLFFRPSRKADAQTVHFNNILPGSQAQILALVDGGVTVHDEEGELLGVDQMCSLRGLALSERALVLRFRNNLGVVPKVVREATLLFVSRRGGAFAAARFAGETADCAGAGFCLETLTPPELLRPFTLLDQGEPLLPGRFLRQEARRSGRALADVEAEQRARATQVLSAGLAAVFASQPRCRALAITLRADAIDEIRVTGCGQAMLAGVQFVTLARDEAERDWERLAGPICLPIDPLPAYPCSESPPGGEERAKLRLPLEADLPPDAPTLGELVDRLLGPSFGELQAGLSQMWEDPTPQHLQVRTFFSDDPEDDTTYELQIVRETLLGCLDPYFARILGMYFVDNRPGGPWDYRVEAEWPAPGDVLRLSWIAFGVQQEAMPKPAGPTGVTAAAIPGASRVAADGTVSPFQMDAGVRWARPTDCDLSDATHAFAAYLVERTEIDAPAAGPYRPANERVFEEGGVPESVPLLLTDPQGESDYPLGYFVDRGPGYGVLHYRVLARDLFGRTSAPSAPAQVELRDEVAPPPPVNLRALYFDLADPDAAGGATLAWANRDAAPGDAPRTGTLVEWVWSLERQQQAPDLAEFRLYFRHGLLNAFTGNVLAVSELSAGRYRVETDLPSVGPEFPSAPAPVDLGSLVNEGETYVLETLATVSGRLQFELRAHVQAPPLPGRCTYNLGPGIPARKNAPALPPYPAFRDYREANSWGGLALEPASVTPLEPLRIRSDGTILSPLPDGLTPADVEVELSSEPADGGVHLHYRVRLRGLTLQPTRTRPRATGSFAVTAVDDASPGNEGRCSPPAGIFAVHRQPPNIPDLEFPDESLATPADFFGDSYFTMRWEGESGVGYLLYRASDAELMAEAGVSMSDHRSLTPGEQRLQLVTLGSRQANISAFNPVTTAPVVASGDGSLSYRDRLDGAVRNRFVYRLRAIDEAGNLAPWPPDPAPADASKMCVLVAIPPATPPSQPHWAGSEPRETGLVLRWNPNAESDLAGYRLYRGYDAADSQDVRTMTPLFASATPEDAPVLSAVRVSRAADGSLTVEALPPGDRTPGRLVQFVDVDVEPGRPVAYRLVAEDSAGNRSVPSEALATRYPKLQPPEPPEWESPVVSTDEVALSWTAVEDDLRSLVLRRRPDSAFWQPLGPWLAPGGYALSDAGVESGVVYEYVVRVRDRVGHVVESEVLVVNT